MSYSEINGFLVGIFQNSIVRTFFSVARFNTYMRLISVCIGALIWVTQKWSR